MKFLRKQISIIFLLIAVCSFAYIFLKITINSNEEVNYNYLYYIIPLIFIINSAITHFVNNESKNYFIIINRFYLYLLLHERDANEVC